MTLWEFTQAEVWRKMINSGNTGLATNRFFVSDFKCEVDPLHITFKAQKSHLPFMEAHHFIPMKFQNHFTTPLDNLHNIICLCPICHRAMHHAEVEYKYELVNKIYIKRPELHSLTVEDIAQYYNCLKIISN